jgi:hypothetical protein
MPAGQALSDCTYMLVKVLDVRPLLFVELGR